MRLFPPPINPMTLVALDIAGVTEIYRSGGAQAIAAMALGTETIKPVQKIVGPGNVYVTLAKMMLREHVEIDFPAGPSEIGIIADHTADPRIVAADVLAQAEHDPNAACILITTDKNLPGKVGQEITALLAKAPRKEIIEKALDNSGYTLVADMEEAIAASDRVHRSTSRSRLQIPCRLYPGEKRRCDFCWQILCRCLRGLCCWYQPRPANCGVFEDVFRT